MEFSLEQRLEAIKDFCLNAKGTNPIEIAKGMMNLECIPMHGPIHHILDGSAFLCALHNAGVEFDLDSALTEMSKRGQLMPGGACGKWGMCGSSSSVGAALAIIHNTSSASDDKFYKDNFKITSKALERIGEVGGPRCCKRNAFISILAGMEVVEKEYGIKLDKNIEKCEYCGKNSQCIGSRCPFNESK